MSARAFMVAHAVVWSAFFIAGCNVQRSPEERKASSDAWVGQKISEHTLSDGTRCAVIAYERAAGISCDWGRK